MIEDTVHALAANTGGRPIEKLVLLRIAMSSGMPGAPIRLRQYMVEETDLSEAQFFAAVRDLEQRKLLRFDPEECSAALLLA